MKILSSASKDTRELEHILAEIKLVQQTLKTAQTTIKELRSANVSLGKRVALLERK